MAPIVVGRLEGSDTAEQFRGFPIVITAHLDQPAREAAGDCAIAKADVDDNTTAVAGLLALTEALRQSSVRPPRPVVFVVTSGGAQDKANWGIQYYMRSYWPPFIRLYWWAPAALALTLERLTPAAGDPLVVEGLRDLELPQPLSWLAVAHPELGVTVADADSAGCAHAAPAGPAACRSDRSAFVRVGLPGLAVYNGAAAAQRASQAPRGQVGSEGVAAAEPDAEAAVRMLRLVFHLVYESVYAPRVARWTTRGRGRMLSDREP